MRQLVCIIYFLLIKPQVGTSLQIPYVMDDKLSYYLLTWALRTPDNAFRLPLLSCLKKYFKNPNRSRLRQRWMHLNGFLLAIWLQVMSLSGILHQINDDIWIWYDYIIILFFFQRGVCINDKTEYTFFLIISYYSLSRKGKMIIWLYFLFAWRWWGDEARKREAGWFIIAPFYSKIFSLWLSPVAIKNADGHVYRFSIYSIEPFFVSVKNYLEIHVITNQLSFWRKYITGDNPGEWHHVWEMCSRFSSNKSQMPGQYKKWL